MSNRIFFAAFAALLALGIFSPRTAHAVAVQINVGGGSPQQINGTTLSLIDPAGKPIAGQRRSERPRGYSWDVPAGNYTLHATTDGKSVDRPLTVPASGAVTGTYDLGTNVFVETAPREPRGPWSFNIGPNALIAIQNTKVSIGGTNSGTFSASNGDAVPMIGLNAGVAYRTGLGFSLAGGLMAGVSPGNQFSATGMTTGGYNVDIKSNVSGPIVAPYLGIGTRIPGGGNVFFQSGFWLQQDRETVRLTQTNFTETFTQDQEEVRPFVGIGYKGSLDFCNIGLGNIGNIGNIGNNFGHVELRANAMYIFGGSNQLIPGGNNLSFAKFQARGNFAFSAGLSVDLH